MLHDDILMVIDSEFAVLDIITTRISERMVYLLILNCSGAGYESSRSYHGDVARLKIIHRSV